MPADVVLKSVIPEYAAGLHTQGQKWLDTTLAQIAELMQALCPTDTSSLHDSIMVHPASEEAAAVHGGGGPAWAAGSIGIGDTQGGYKGSDKKEAGKPINYAEAVNYGTSTHAATPFIEPAVEEKWPTAIEELRMMLGSYGVSVG